MPRTNSIKQVREHYGLTQEQLAIFLSVSKGMIAMAETGKRTLPTAALLKLGQLQLLKADSKSSVISKKAAEQLQKQSATGSKALQRYAMDCQIKVQSAQRKLSTMEAKHTQAMRTLQMVEQLQQQDNTNAAWLGVVEATALKQIKRSGETAQQKLRVEMDVALYAAKKANTALKKN